MAVVALVLAMAPVGLPILSDDTWRNPAVADAGTRGRAPSAFLYQWGAEAGAATRVERSDDGGSTWHSVAAIPAAVKELQPVRGQESLAFARADDSIWVTEDGGETWAQASALPGRITAIAVSNADPGTVFVGTESSGLLRTNDRGATWQPVNSPELLLGGAGAMYVGDVAINPDDEQVLYAATGVWLGTSTMRLAPLGVFISVDGGRQWFTMARAPLGAAPITGLRPIAGSLTSVGVQDVDGERVIELKLDSGLVEGLSSDNATRRAAAARAVGFIGDRNALPYLAARLNDPDSLAGDRVVEAVAALGGKESLPELRTMLDARDEALRARAAYGLGLLKDTASVSALGEMLHGDAALPARRAAEALAMIATPEAIDALVRSLHGGSADAARHAALIGLTQVGRPAIEPLATQLASADPVLRSNAAQALGWLKPVEATDALIAALGDSDASVRSEAAWALGELGTTDAREALAAALERETNAEAKAAVDAALVQAQRASGASAIEVGSGGALLHLLAQVPPTRWTLFGLGIILAVALLLIPPMHVRQGSA